MIIFDTSKFDIWKGHHGWGHQKAVAGRISEPAQSNEDGRICSYANDVACQI